MNQREDKGGGNEDQKQIHTHTHTHKHTYIKHSWHTVNTHYLQIKYLLSHLLKFICNPKSIFTALSQSFTDTCIAVKLLSHLTRYQLRLNKVMICLLVSALTVSKCPFCHLISAFCVFLLVISLFIMAPKCTAKVLSCVSKCKKAVACLMEKIHFG